MIMHGTWYKGPQLAHPHTDYAQYRSYPSFVVTSFHQPHHSDATQFLSHSNGDATEGAYGGQVPAQLASDLGSTIKIEQGFSETATPLGIEEYGINLECVESTFRKPSGYVWPINPCEVVAVANNSSISAASSPPSSTFPETNLNEEKSHVQHFDKYESQLKSPSQVASSSAPVESSDTTPVTPPNLETAQRPTIKNHTHGALQQNSTMPIGGVQSQNPTQGLVHWMSAVMAEHMTGQTHHDPTAIGSMHYMWNGNVDCGQHSKDIGEYNNWPTPRNHMPMKQGYEAKMSDHHSNLQKGHFVDDNRLNHHQVVGSQGTGLIGTSMIGNSSGGGTGGGLHHGNHLGTHHSSAAVAAASAALLVVPQPINASKIGATLAGGGTGGTGRKYQCKMCPQIFSSKADLQLHTQIHMREAKPYKCTQCSKAFANSSYLSQHTRIHLGIKPYRCEICQRKFTQLSHLQQHIRTHTGDKPYKCRHPGCQKAFSQLSNLQSHSRCHQTDKPFKCNSCYKCFSDEPSLLEHIPKHKESKHLKTHICQYCGKSYTQETYLTKHMQKHAERTDKRPPIIATNSVANAAIGGGTPGGGIGTGHNSSNGNTGGVSGAGTSSIPNANCSASGAASVQQNRNNSLGLPAPPSVSITASDHSSYWPKVSPDSAATANMTDVMQHQQQQQQQQHHLHQHQTQPGSAQQQQQHQHQQHMDFSGVNTHQSANASAGGAGPPNGHPADLQTTHHRMSDSGREDMVSTPSTVGPYDASSITKTTSNSAFTPINSMPHLNTLGHHPMSQRPYLYDAISFQNKNINQNNGAPTAFPNQLISLHQIRNYAHQPASLMTGEHLLGVSVGSGKDKG